MAKTTYNLYEAKSSLSKLVDRAAAGQEIIIAKAGQPRAKLVRAGSAHKPRKPGGWEGRVRWSKNFDAPLPRALRRAFDGGG